MARLLVHLDCTQVISGKPFGAPLLTGLTRFWLPSPSLSISWLLAVLHLSSPLTLCGATLLASKKKNGGHRPIAVGEVLRRLVSKYLATLVHHQVLALLSPLQLGVGGCEALVHATSRLILSLSHDDSPVGLH